MKHFISFKNMQTVEAMKGALLGSMNSENLTIAYTDMKAGVEIPLHHHPEEAIDIILEGVLEMKIGEEEETMTHGMMSVVPSNIPHRAIAITDCKVVSIFFPMRAM